MNQNKLSEALIKTKTVQPTGLKTERLIDKKLNALNKFERKPNPGMFLKAINKWNVDIKKSFFIGDQLTDLEVSKKVGLRFYYKKNISFFEQLNQILKQ